MWVNPYADEDDDDMDDFDNFDVTPVSMRLSAY